MFTARRVSRSTALLAAAVASAAATCSAGASDIVVQAAPQSLEIQYQISGTGVPAEGVYKVSQAQIATGMRIGVQTSGFGGTNATTGVNGGIQSLLFFQTPTAPTGTQLSGVSMRFTELASNNNIPDFNVDLYAVGFDKGATPSNDSPPYNTSGIASANIAPNYYYFPTLSTDVDARPIRITQTNGTVVADSGANPMLTTRIQDNMLAPADWSASAGTTTDHTTTSTANGALLSFVQALYARPDFTPGNYLVLRMNPDVKSASTTAKRYQIPYNDASVVSPVIIPQLTFTFSPSSLPGDVNHDHIVDLGDVNYVTARWLNTGTPGTLDGDADGNGTVDLGDINFITARWLNTGEPGGVAGALTSVPEPTSLATVGLAAVALLRRRRD